MITADQIPDEVVEAVHKSLDLTDAARTLDDYDVRATIAAALNAWEGMQHDDTHNKRTGYIILPLPKDAADE